MNTWDLGPGTWDLGPGTWNLGPGNLGWDLGPGTWDPSELGPLRPGTLRTWDPSELGPWSWDLGVGTHRSWDPLELGPSGVGTLELGPWSWDPPELGPWTWDLGPLLRTRKDMSGVQLCKPSLMRKRKGAEDFGSKLVGQ